MEGFHAPAPHAEDSKAFERRMQDTYLGPMNGELNKIRDLLPNLDPSSRVADLLNDTFYELNTMPEENMDEEDLKKELEALRKVAEDMQVAMNPEDAYAVALKGLERDA